MEKKNKGKKIKKGPKWKKKILKLTQFKKAKVKIFADLIRWTTLPTVVHMGSCHPTDTVSTRKINAPSLAIYYSDVITLPKFNWSCSSHSLTRVDDIFASFDLNPSYR